MAGLVDHLRQRIAREGPLTVARYMEEALSHPRYGYYRRSDPLGAAGDFITAPEISQMFGELIGLWCAVVWEALGSPAPVNLVELGPGRGTLMADALRAARRTPAFLAAVAVHLVETSPLLRARQRDALPAAGVEGTPAWHEDFDGVPDGPLLLIANEFFDALPVRQFQRSGDGWRERLVDVGSEGDGFRFVLSPHLPEVPLAADTVPPGVDGAPEGSVIEVCPVAIGLARAIGERVAGRGGAALIVDYGHAESAFGETLQAVKGHAYHPVLSDPGAADLTAHVDFAALARAAVGAGARTFGPVDQGEFLERLGLGARAGGLLAKATPEQAAEIRAARRRLADREHMGALFKALAITGAGMAPPPGFA